MDILVPKIGTNKPQKEQMLSDFAQGIGQHGDNAVVLESLEMPTLEQLESTVAGVYYGPLRVARLHYDQRQQIKQLMHYFYNKCVVIETPLIDRLRINNEFRVGINGYLRNNAIWAWNNIDQTRVKKFYKNRTVDINREWSSTLGDNILVVMQNYDDLLTQGIDSFEWTLDTITKLRQYTDRNIVVRSNPYHTKQENTRLLEFGQQLSKFKKVEFFYSGRKEPLKSITDHLNEAWCVVCHSSGVSVDAVIKGIPAICLGEQCMAWDVCDHELANVENPTKPNTVQWFEKIAMIQYTQQEFRSGECWDYIKPLCL